jgi:hypothetical protein
VNPILLAGQRAGLTEPQAALGLSTGSDAGMLLFLCEEGPVPLGGGGETAAAE